MAWRSLLKNSCPGDHLVQLYQDDAFLCDAVARYASESLRRGGCAMLIATPAHRRHFVAALQRERVDLDAARAEARFELLDAQSTLEALLRGGMPDRDAFRDVLGTTVARLCAKGDVRAFGEMVGLLWAEGRHDAAAALEEL